MDVTSQVYFASAANKCGAAADVPHLLICRTAQAALGGHAVQRACSEMLHWDEYREAFGVQDGTGKMMDAFFTRTAAPFAGYTFKPGKYNVTAKAYSVALNPAFCGLPLQRFCSEMEHWDAYREANGAQGGDKSMRELFYPNIFAGNEMFVLDASSKLLALKIMSIVNSRESYGKATQMLCAEMIHWDDFQRDNGVLPNPAMEVVFGKH
ncbi:uncharacterized protein Tco025E_05923 [Trypanosoma conorhini]|uniref:Uncharacterized protein n=1 Tax=Trypanosoma conorhini TaxID=83891 RepID=A0A422P8X0_9TRYP|nr:uncharacterized protein Tco025E_05923 [Trypanosoma conorhini]RNF14157.1 hypothetical protein Tco025E_05923 [Trypanosoma conorhini]